MSNVRYYGRRNADRTCSVVREDTRAGQQKRELLHHLYPDAVRFGWGTMSPDAVELARVILLDASGSAVQAEKYARQFAEEIVAVMPDAFLLIAREAVTDWLSTDDAKKSQWVPNLAALWRNN